MRDGSPSAVVESGKKRRKRGRAPRYSSRKQIERARMRREGNRESRFTKTSEIRRTLTPLFATLPVETYSRRRRHNVPAVVCQPDPIAPLAATLTQPQPRLNIDVQGESKLRDQSPQGHYKCNYVQDIQVRLHSCPN